MSDLRKAAEMALDYIRREGWTNSQGKEVFIALSQALAQPEQEPVAWMFKHKKTGNLTFFDSKATAYWFAKNNDRWESIPLYTAPPKREWVEITKGECDELFRSASDHVEYAYAIEAKLRLKNGY